MFGLFSSLGSYYYISVPLQILAIIHAIKTGRRQWIYLLIFIPLIGVVVYFFMEVLPDLRRGGLSANFQKYFFPNQRINEWTRKVRVSDNITNKLGLSNAYAERGQYEKAIELASGCLKGLYADDPGIFLQLARQHFHNRQYKESILYFDKLNKVNSNRFNMVEDDLLYVRALEGSGQEDLADQGYRRVIRAHHSIEARYYYGLFLKKQQRREEARFQFQSAREELKSMPRYLRRRYGVWSRRSLKELLALKK
jgi:hypothetical protein